MSIFRKGHFVNNILLRVLIPLIVSSAFNSAFSQLTVRTDSYGSKPGYIDNATLVVEPHGAYVEQSLYLSYSDHNQFPSSQVEIVHRFELPANAVINDLWLWIGDSVMQARMLDTWKARAIYDSIVSKKRDPAFLSKNGNIYELHIYPLISGKFRKVKMNFITPTRWFGTDGTAELPLKLLKDNNASKKPVQILFREVERIWGQPALQELPLQTFTVLRDSGGYKYKSAAIPDISGLTSFTMGFTTNFVNGFFITSADVKSDGTYFQFGFNPGSLFNLQVDPASNHLLYALDLSGVHNKKFSTLIPNVKQLMRSTAKPNDSIAVMIAGAGKIDQLSTSWKIGNTDSINAVLDRFAASAWGQQVAQDKLPTILYADNYASTCWQFPGLDSLATYKNYTDLASALQDMKGADVIAGYRHGYEDIGITSWNYVSIIAKIDSFFAQGGRFLSYFDYNRVGIELIGSHYIPGLTVTRRVDVSTTLYRNPAGNIGIYFPESFVHYGFDFLQYTADPSIKVEVQDNNGTPVVISKKIGNGLIVISGIWAFRDDGALRALLSIPMLGLNGTLNGVRKNQQLTGLLTNVQTKYKQTTFDKTFIISNSDTLTKKIDALIWTSSYMNGFGASMPKFTTVNLLDGAGYLPASVTDAQVQYYGSGMLLKTIANAGKGRHFETHIDTWPYIVSALNVYAYPVADSMTVSVTADNGMGQLKDLREVNPMPLDANKSRFFIGSTSLVSRIQFNVRARFAGAADGQNSSTVFFTVRDSSKIETVLPSMLGKEKLNDLFNQQNKDTSTIVTMAMRYRLLCDYTALLALEPNDTVHYMKNPFDESQINISQVIDDSMTDSLSLVSYPNPFNNQTSIVVNCTVPTMVNVGIYNILGQRVKVLAVNDVVAGKKTYAWNGSDANNRPVSSGAYFVRLIAMVKSSGELFARFRKIVFLK